MWKLTFNRALLLVAAAAAGTFLSGPFVKVDSSGSATSGERAKSRHAAPRPPREVRRAGHFVMERELDMDLRRRLAELESIAARDPRSALLKLAAFQKTEFLTHALTAMARGWAASEPAAAANWLTQLDCEEDQVSAALGLIPAWASRDTGKCLDWTLERPAGNLREIALAEVADAWTGKDPVQALGRFLSLTPEAGTERGLHIIVAQWVLDAPAAAIAHLSNMDPAMRRDEFLETALVSLTLENPDLAWQQAERFQDRTRVEHVRGIALEAIAESRPHEALRLARSAGDPPALLQAVVRGWASWDEPAARSWIGSLKDEALVETLGESLAE